MKHEETAKRLRKAMEMNNIRQRELSIKADVNETSISHYYNGTHKPSNISAGKIGAVLNVNPMWLMGFDVPMVDTPDTYDNFTAGMVLAFLGMKLESEELIRLQDFAKLTKEQRELVLNMIEQMKPKEE